MLRAQVEIGLAAGHLGGAMSAYEQSSQISETYPTPGFRAWADQAHDACTALLTSIGYQTGLFGALAATGPATSAKGRGGRSAERALRAGLA
jgi:hypothetical protein